VRSRARARRRAFISISEYQRSTISTRRLSWRPGSSALEAMGARGPAPWAVMRVVGMA